MPTRQNSFTSNEKCKIYGAEKATVKFRHRLHDINFSDLEFPVKQENEGLIIEHTASIENKGQKKHAAVNTNHDKMVC